MSSCVLGNEGAGRARRQVERNVIVLRTPDLITVICVAPCVVGPNSSLDITVIETKLTTYLAYKSQFAVENRLICTILRVSGLLDVVSLPIELSRDEGCCVRVMWFILVTGILQLGHHLSA